MGMRRHTMRAALALGLALTAWASLGIMSSALAQPPALTKQQSDAREAYDAALSQFRAIVGERRAQINAKRPLPDLPGQALYLARVNMMSTYKDLTDALPSTIGRPNKFKIPPQYFDADNEPLVEDYRNLFDIMEAPPAGAQDSPTPFKDVVELGIAIARARGLDPVNAETAGRISLAL